MSFIRTNNATIPAGAHFGRRIIMASDHRGFDSKLKLIDWLTEKGSVLEGVLAANNKFYLSDVGCHSNKRCDYAEYAQRAALSVSNDWLNSVGIAICGSGIGMSIASAKFPRVYPARCLTIEDAILSRKHNNSNFLCLSAQTGDLKEIVSAWLFASFYESPEDEPYLQRFLNITGIERKLLKYYLLP